MHPHTLRFGVRVSGDHGARGAPHGPGADRQSEPLLRTKRGAVLLPIAGGEPTWQEKLRTRRSELLDGCEYLDQLAAAGEGRAPTDDEAKSVREALDEIDRIDVRLKDDDELAERRQRAGMADQDSVRRTQEQPARVTGEPRTYGPHSRHSFFSDAYRAVRLGDAAAQARLATHAREVEVEGEGPERRDVTTAAFGGLIVPIHLVEEFAAVLRNGRAIANSVRSLPLPPEGMVLKLPRGQTGSTVAPQATQNTAVSETDVDFDDDVTINVRTFAGQQDVSRQSLERGAPGTDQLLYADLVADYAAKLDTSVIVDDGTSGTHVGFQNVTGENVVTYTDATPTVAEFWSKLADAVQQVGSNRKLPATIIAMHPRRWGWITASLDSQNRPLVVHGNASDAVNAMGEAAALFGEGQLVGTLQGLPAIVDGNIPTNIGAVTNEDVIYVYRRQDPILMEEGDGLPRQLRFDEVGAASLTIKLLVYGYSAFTAERFPKGLSRITGTGLVTPTF